MSEESKIDHTFNEFFSNVAKELKIEKDDPILNAIKNYENHPSILRIKHSCKDPKVFSFKYFNVEDVKRKLII